MIRPRPAIKFLVEADGADTFWMARRQLLFALPDWPMSLHVFGSQEPHLFSGNRGDGIGQGRRRRAAFPPERDDSAPGGDSRPACPAHSCAARWASRRAFAQVASVVVAVAAITWYVQCGQGNRISRQSPLTGSTESVPVPLAVAHPDVGPGPEAPPVETKRDQVVQDPPLPPPLDSAAVAEGEEALDAASRDRAAPINAPPVLAGRLSQLTGQAALDAARARKLAFLARDPSTRITQAATRGGFLRGERASSRRS